MPPLPQTPRAPLPPFAPRHPPAVPIRKRGVLPLILGLEMNQDQNPSANFEAGERQFASSMF